jgi:hypothetical protein
VLLLVLLGAFHASGKAPASNIAEPAAMLKNNLTMIGLLWLWVYFVYKGMRDYSQSVLQFFGLKSLKPGDLLGDLAVAVLGFGLIFLCSSGVHALLPETAAANPLLSATPRGLAGIAAWISLSISAGICEEIVFRGYLQRQLASISGKVAIAIAAQALVFGLGHAYEGLASVSAIILHGLILGVMAHWRGNIRAGIIEHAGWDLLAGFSVI